MIGSKIGNIYFMMIVYNYQNPKIRKKKIKINAFMKEENEKFNM